MSLQHEVDIEEAYDDDWTARALRDANQGPFDPPVLLRSWGGGGGAAFVVLSGFKNSMVNTRSNTEMKGIALDS